MHRPVDGRLEALLEVCDQIAGIAAEQLVSTLAAEHDLPIAFRELRDHELRKRTWTRDRIVQVVDHLAGVVDEVVDGDLEFVEVDSLVPAERPGIAALVVFGPLGELAEEGLEAVARLLRGQAGDDARVQPAAQVSPDRDVGSEMDPHGVGHQLAQPLLEVARIVFEIEVVVDLPVTRDIQIAVSGHQHVTRRDLANALEERLAVQAELEDQVVAQAFDVRRHLGQERQDGLRLGCEVQPACHDRVVERLHPEPVAGAEERSARRVPNGECEHAPQMRQAVGAPAPVGRQDDLGIGRGLERLGPEFVAQLDVVVDLAVEGDPVSGFVHHGLGAGHEVDDRQPPVNKPDPIRRSAPGPLPVRAAMGNEVVHGRETAAEFGDGLAVQAENTGNSTHG